MRHTHRGHCQVCGRVQAAQLRDGKIAKHGYEVKGGYFSGTCSGSGERPLELERAVCDAFAARCEQNADAHERAAGEYAAGVRLPLRVSYGNKWEQAARNGRGAFVEQWKTWDEADETHRAGQVRREVDEHTRHADFLRSHARRLRELAAHVHGQPLQPAEPEPVDLVKKGAAILAYGKRYVVKEIVKHYNGARRVSMVVTECGKKFNKRACHAAPEVQS